MDASTSANGQQETNARNLFQDENASDHCVMTRPHYSDQVFKTITEFCLETNTDLNLVVDIGCGPGNSTLGFCKFFKKVIGIDISDTQIANAPKDIQNCEFRVEDATELSFLGNETVDLVTAGLALNLMPIDKVLVEVDRVLKPGGTLAIFGYLAPVGADQRVKDIFEESTSLVKPYVTPEIAHLLSRYEDIELPYPGVTSKDNIQVTKLVSFTGLMSFWPVIQRVLHMGGHDTENTYLKHMQERALNVFPDYQKSPDEPVIELVYDIFMKMVHKPR